MIQPAFEILNQRGTPMFFSDIYANIPTAGIVGRIFISTDTKEFYRDTGTTWELIGGPGSGTITGSGTAGTLPIWTSSSVLGNSSLLEGASKISTTKDFQADAYYLNGMTAGSGALYWTSDRVTLANYNSGGIVHIEVNGGLAAQVLSSDLSSTFYGNVLATQKVGINKSVPSVALDVVGRSYILDTATYSTGTIQSQTIDKQLTIPNAASISNGVGLTSQLVGGTTTFQGSVTIPNTTPLANNLISNSFAFSGAGTITLTQAAGLRTSAASMIQSFFSGSASSTITHYSAQAIYGFYNINSGSITPVIQNAYMLLINDMNDYSHTFTFNNRWGIYQAGTNDKNYFAANMLLGSVIDNGNRLQVNGNIYAGNTGGDTTIQVQSFSGSGSSNLRLINTSGSVQYDWNVQGLGSDGRFRIYDNAGSVGEWFTILQNGNVGIGVSPVLKLDVQGNPADTGTISSTTVEQVTLFRPSNGVGGIRSGFNTTSGDAYIWSSQSGASLNFGTRSAPNNTAYLHITSSGLIGIGTSSPADKLVVEGSDVNVTSKSTSNISAFKLINTSGTSLMAQVNNALVFEHLGTERMRLTSAGNLLLGTTTDSGQKLQVNGTSLFSSTTTFASTGGSGLRIYGGSGTNQWDMYLNGANLRFSDNTGGGSFRIDTSLYLLGSLRIDGQTSGTAGGNSGQHLIINCDGTTYKIALLNP